MTTDEIRQALEGRKIKVIAKEIGLHPNVLYNIMHGRTNPSYKTAQKISAWVKSRK